MGKFLNSQANELTDRAPTVNDDETAGFQVGSRWIDVSDHGAVWTCSDTSRGAAVWNAPGSSPFPTFGGGTVAHLNTNYPAASYDGGTATVTDADTPVVGSIVVGSGTTRCVVISNGTDYLVTFIFP